MKCTFAEGLTHYPSWYSLDFASFMKTVVFFQLTLHFVAVALCHVSFCRMAICLYAAK